MEVNHMIGAGLFIALLLAWWWASSTLKWMVKEEDEKVIFMDRLREQRKSRRKEVYRNGFGKNFFQEKTKRKVVERDIDKIIAEVGSQAADDNILEFPEK